MENSMEIPQEIKNRIYIWSSYSTSGYLSKGYKNTNSYIYNVMYMYMHTFVFMAVTYNSQESKYPSMDELDKCVV